MTEKEEAFLEKIHQIFETALAQDREKKKQKEEASSTESSQKHEHWKAEDISDSCPECVAEKQKIASAEIKKRALASKDLEYECVGCGEHFSKKEKECPTCHGTKVRSL